METSSPLSILRDASLRDAPQDEGEVDLLVKELHEQLAHLLRLLLLHPVPGALDQMAAKDARAGALPHALDIAGNLVGAPVALARDEHRWHVDGAAGEYFELGIENALRAAAIPLQPALKARASELAAVDRELVVGQPFARGDLLSRRHLRRHGRGHVLVQVHDVEVGILASSPALQDLSRNGLFP